MSPNPQPVPGVTLNGERDLIEFRQDQFRWIEHPLTATGDPQPYITPMGIPGERNVQNARNGDQVDADFRGKRHPHGRVARGLDERQGHRATEGARGRGRRQRHGEIIEALNPVTARWRQRGLGLVG